MIMVLFNIYAIRKPGIQLGICTYSKLEILSAHYIVVGQEESPKEKQMKFMSLGTPSQHEVKTATAGRGGSWGSLQCIGIHSCGVPHVLDELIWNALFPSLRTKARVWFILWILVQYLEEHGGSFVNVYSMHWIKKWALNRVFSRCAVNIIPGN